MSDGKIDFLEDRIKFYAQAKFRGLPGIVLFPVSQILEYIGEGTVGDPKWRPRFFSIGSEKGELRKPDQKPRVSEETEKTGKTKRPEAGAAPAKSSTPTRIAK